MGLMRRRYGYYWAKLIGAVLILAATREPADRSEALGVT